LYQVLVAGYKERKAYKVELEYRVLVDYKALLVQELKALLVPKEPLEQVHRASKDAKAQQVLVPKELLVPKVFKVYRVVA
jgi:hypothetical protein